MKHQFVDKPRQQYASNIENVISHEINANGNLKICIKADFPPNGLREYSVFVNKNDFIKQQYRNSRTKIYNGDEFYHYFNALDIKLNCDSITENQSTQTIIKPKSREYAGFLDNNSPFKTSGLLIYNYDEKNYIVTLIPREIPYSEQEKIIISLAKPFDFLIAPLTMILTILGLLSASV